MTILVTGGAGYIGSHTVLQLLEAGEPVVVLDNLSNSSPEALRRVESLCGLPCVLVEGDVRNESDLRSVFDRFTITAVIHFAGLKAVGESTQLPLRYYENNVQGSIKLCQVMADYGCKKIVFSSSATVYGDPIKLPLDEDMPTGQPINPYGSSKLMVEQVLRDLAVADSDWRVILLRYFNPVGAHPSGMIGEDPLGKPNNLMPFISQVAVGRRACLSVFGDDYPTVDGTGVRDYIHVVDLAAGHISALKKLPSVGGVATYNLGTGQGHSVLEVVAAFEAASGCAVPYQIEPRRSGDVASCYAKVDLAELDLGWRAELDLKTMCEDTWRWQSQNPDGYDSGRSS